MVGGSKISTKLGLLESLIEKVNRLIRGGGILNTLMRAAGLSVGKSLCEEPLLSVARSLMDKARARGDEIPLPEDCICAKEYSPTARTAVTPTAEVSADDLILDIGPKTAARFAGELAPYLGMVAAQGEVYVQVWMREGAAAVEMALSDEWPDEVIPEVLRQHL